MKLLLLLLLLLPQGCCYGCGATLQTEVPGGPGYVAPAKYQVGCSGEDLVGGRGKVQGHWTSGTTLA